MSEITPSKSRMLFDGPSSSPSKSKVLLDDETLDLIFETLENTGSLPISVQQYISTTNNTTNKVNVNSTNYNPYISNRTIK